jgi:hypothetical protein
MHEADRASASLLGNVPTALTTFIGRDRELDEVRHLAARVGVPVQSPTHEVTHCHWL